jgi:hypothetical protein
MKYTEWCKNVFTIEGMKDISVTISGKWRKTSLKWAKSPAP